MELHITFRGMETSPAAEARIRQRVSELEQICDRITHCRVVVETLNRSHRKGNLLGVHVDLSVPGGKVIVNRDSGDDHAHEDLHVAIRDAFDAARRRLRDHMRRMEGEIKTHAPETTGRIVRLVPEQDHGFLDGTPDGDIYFHRNSVKGAGFDSLRIGSRVRYTLDPEPAEKGAHASAVFPLD